MKIINHITSTDITGNEIAYTVIAVQETAMIAGDPLENTHYYWVPAGADLNDTANYLEPLDQIDQNFDTDYQLYREQYGFLFPEGIKAARAGLGLTLRETALLLAMSFSTLSNIENGLVLQSLDQEIKLRLLTQPAALTEHVRQHQQLFASRATRQSLDARKLFAKLHLPLPQ
ncbi:helix-turn-helix domain-containing protein [Levilactobacillus suantsaiihabitans]|uniref:Helix-turn-helix domain-containing protein n=1 Tax=Levilactobacillus suantsaiihabitans TaxID=2487722 RepID=A0A4Z0J6F0_9LACO|nr:helix-turn-helix domain-containing protein [Levilactobacillus suantsaiihabitans]TGD17445.1 helix-turn-helix domain-containing protein [Levilactobacillus suantsaiihabitans]